MTITALRQEYHRGIFQLVLRTSEGVPNFADKGSKASRDIAWSIIQQLGYSTGSELVSGQRRGNQFEQLTKNYLHEAFLLVNHLRPGKWVFQISGSIDQFEQYQHLAYLQQVLKEHPKLTSALGGDYLIKPDIVIARYPVPDNEINTPNKIIDPIDNLSRHTPLRLVNHSKPTLLLHASVSCKWTLRSVK